MAFPIDPALNQVYVYPNSGVIYRWDGEKWTTYGGTAGFEPVPGATGPQGPSGPQGASGPVSTVPGPPGATGVAGTDTSIVNVKNYGALGNGYTDDTTSIQNAINYAQNNDLTVEFEEGKTYKITSPLTFKHGKSASDTKSWHVRIKGNNCIIRPSGSGLSNNYAIKVIPRCLLQDKNSGRAQADIQISGIWFDGSLAGSTTHSMKIGETGYFCDNWRWGNIEDITVGNYNYTSAGEIRFEECRHIVCSRIDLRNNSLILETKAATGFTGDMMFYGCEFAGTNNPPLVLKSNAAGGEVRGVHFQDCQIYRSGSYLDAANQGIIGDIWFSNCQFDGPGSPAGETALAATSTIDGRIFQLHVIGCYFVNYTSAALHFVRNTVNNNFPNTEFRQIEIRGGGMNLITGNSNSGNGAIYCESLDNFSISGISFHEMNCVNLIAVTSCTNYVVKENILTGSSTTVDHGVTTGGTGNNFYIISDNILPTKVSSINHYTTGTKYVVSNNLR